MTPAEQLAAVPEPVQTELVRLTRWIHGMSPEQRATALDVVVTVAETFVALTGGNQYPTIRMLDAWGQVVRTIDTAESPRQEVS